MDESYKPAVSTDEKVSQFETTLKEHGISVEQWIGEKGPRQSRIYLTNLKLVKPRLNFPRQGKF